MKLKIEEIIVDPAARIRQGTGDLAPLKNSIAKVGLLHPLVVDENYRLISGFRRYTACQELKIEEIEVAVINCADNKHLLLDIELAENLGRENFSEEELQIATRRREDIILELRGNWWQRFSSWLKSCFISSPTKK